MILGYSLVCRALRDFINISSSIMDDFDAVAQCALEAVSSCDVSAKETTSHILSMLYNHFTPFCQEGDPYFSLFICLSSV